MVALLFDRKLIQKQVCESAARKSLRPHEFRPEPVARPANAPPPPKKPAPSTK
ncbi:hypothetical protein [Algicella marina]|uniref:Uncharacterized protein n=1 Tax=Algicella marina TaxID=2683284 RepID=A0A6P1T0H4_9RHOB|nr:hypothetical protein [Algicella marina]QHQ36414.1 hypothetical protein GO499_15140 [Algicella marina]